MTFTIDGISVRFELGFLVFLASIIILGSVTLKSSGAQRRGIFVTGVILFTLLLVLETFLHEAAHVVVFRWFGEMTQEVVFSMDGRIVSAVPILCKNPAAVFFGSIAGPVISLLYCGAGSLTVLLTGPGLVHAMGKSIMLLFGLTTIVNILPLPGMDGGIALLGILMGTGLQYTAVGYLGISAVLMLSIAVLLVSNRHTIARYVLTVLRW